MLSDQVSTPHLPPGHQGLHTYHTQHMYNRLVSFCPPRPALKAEATLPFVVTLHLQCAGRGGHSRMCWMNDEECITGF